MRKRKITAFKYKYEFESINNEIEAYSLGLFFTDGSVSQKIYNNMTNSQAVIHLQSQDASVLYAINSYVSDDTSVNCTEKYCYIRFSHRDLVSNLINLGCKQNKTYEGLTWPTIPENIISHFIRGVFDGDGCITSDKGRFPKAYIACTDITFLEKIQEVLLSNNISSSINTEKRVGKTFKVPHGYSSNCIDLHRLYIRRKEELKKFKVYLYRDAETLIQRKKDTFDRYVDTEINVTPKEVTSS